MSSIAHDLAAALSTVDRSGDFCTAGTVDLPAPGLSVEGVGPIALPLLAPQAEQLIALAERAPYGRGAETLLDPAVRRTWQIAADRIRIAGKHWPKTLEAVLAQVAEGLGVAEPIAAELYKLLIYDAGSFFVSHRDTEKLPGMFATLVIVLPSVSAGGELVVRHRGREQRLALNGDEPSEARFAAFYADCPHEVLPITSGCRLALVYNLVRRGGGAPPEPPEYEDQQSRIVALLQAWAADLGEPRDHPPEHDGTGQDASDDGPEDEDEEDEDEDDDDDGDYDDDLEDDDAEDDEAGGERPPEKLIYLLEHAYTPAELGFAALKGVDAAVAGVLAAAAPLAGCALHLALLTVEESGSAEHVDGGWHGRGRWRDEPETFEVGEISDRSVILDTWRRPDGGATTMGPLPVDDRVELSPPDALDELDPDEEHFHEATGNEGASFERSYRRAALVLWPEARRLAVLSAAGLATTLPLLAELADRWAASGDKSRPTALWEEAHELSLHMLAHGGDRESFGPSQREPSGLGRVLEVLTRLGDGERIEGYLARPAAEGLQQTGDVPPVVAALDRVAAERRVPLLERILVATAGAALGIAGRLLAEAVAAPPGGEVAALAGAARPLLAVLPGDPAREAGLPAWRRAPAVETGFVVDLLGALAAIDEALADHAVDHILAWPQTYGFDAVLVAAAKRLPDAAGEGSPVAASAALARLRRACRAHLAARIAEPLTPPPDWARAGDVGCRCRHCRELAAFLVDPARRVWLFRAAEADRSHVEATIVRAKADIDRKTERRGRPFTLSCTKNQASYERRVVQRRKDLEDLARLGS